MGELTLAAANAGQLATRGQNVGRSSGKGVPTGNTFPATTDSIGLTRKERSRAEEPANMPRARPMLVYHKHGFWRGEAEVQESGGAAFNS